MLSLRRWPLVALFVVALVTRIGFLLADPNPYPRSGLAADSAEVARQIDQHGRWFESNLVGLAQLGTLQNDQQRLIDPAAIDFRAADAHPQFQPEALEPPGEAIVLAGLWKLTGSERWLPYQLLMILLSALTTLLVPYIGVCLFRRPRAAYLGALWYAVFPPIAWLATIPHLDTWGVDFTILVTALLLRSRAADKPVRWLVAAGAAAGVGAYFRPELLLLAPAVGLAVLSRSHWRDAVRFAVLPTLVAIALVAPWTIRNADVFHRFIPMRIGTGQALWEGLGEIHNNFGAELNDAATFAQVHAVRPDLVYGTAAYDSFLLSWGLKAIQTHPGFYIKLVGWRLVEATALLRNTDWFGPVLTPSQAGLSLIGYARHRSGDLLVLALEPFLFLVSVLTIALTWRRFGPSHLIAGAIVLVTILPYVLLHLEARYTLPASFAYLLWTALGVDLLLEKSRRRRVGEPAVGQMPAHRAPTASTASS